MIIFGFIFSLLHLQRSVASIEKSEESLVLAQIVHRHGDRTPTKPFHPTLDPNQESVWPQGWGQLTTTGMKQLFFLGETLRQRYQGFLSDDYVNSELYVRSSGVERALMSAQCNLAGLFPPRGDQRWNSRLPWQPIPIHSSPVYEDWIMRSSKVCGSTLDRFYDEYLSNSPHMKDYIEKHRQLIVNATKESGLYVEGDDIHNLRTAWALGGNLHIARRNNKTLLPWMTDSVIDSLRDLRAEKHSMKSQATPEIKRIQGGPLLGNILNNFVDYTRNSLKPQDHTATKNSTLKMMLFSGHDTNIVALLGAMDLFRDPYVPSYGSALIFELHQRRGGQGGASGRRARSDQASSGDKNFIVKLFFLEGMVKGEPLLRQLKIPNCDSDCKLSRVIQLYQDVTVSSRDQLLELCQIGNNGEND